MKYKVFVDGSEGTTGLEISERLESRDDLEVLQIDNDLRKSPVERKRLINAADIVFLCLPDEAARESVGLVENRTTCILDASTAHRVDPNWTYGLPELKPNQRSLVRSSKRITVPGCHATGFVAVVAPLISSGLLPSTTPTSCFSITGYSGGGKKLISYYQKDLADSRRADTPRLYSLNLQHKHLPEMAYHTGLQSPPVFSPILANIYKGMLVSVPIPTEFLPSRPSAREIHSILEAYYADEQFIRVMPFDDDGSLDDGYLEPTGCNDTNRLELYVFGHESQTLISARLDNLGKGASGAAVQCMNIHLGLDENVGLKA